MPEGAVFDEEAAERAVKWLHILGLKPLPFQEQMVRHVWGWLDQDGHRVVKKVYLELPRGQGKSTTCAALCGLLLFDSEDGEVLCAANDKTQSSIVLNVLKQQLASNPSLEPLYRPFRYEIRVPEKNTVMRRISRDVRVSWGTVKPVGVVYDEVHAALNDDLYRALDSSAIKFTDCVFFLISTAGDTDSTTCFELHERTRKMAQGEIESDGSFAGLIFAAPKNLEWNSPEAFRAAMPGLGVTILESDVARLAKEAMDSGPAAQTAFQKLMLGWWDDGSSNGLLDMKRWDACSADPQVAPGSDVVIGLDLSATQDLTAAMVVSFPDAEGFVDVLTNLWVPGEDLSSKEKLERVPYRQWVSDGFVVATRGRTVDFGMVRRRIGEIGELYNVRAIAYDKYQAKSFIQDLEADGFKMIETPQTTGYLNSATRELIRLTLDGKLRHGGNPAARWCASNTLAAVDSYGNIRPDRGGKHRKKIDAIAGITNALDTVGRLSKRKRANPYAQRALEQKVTTV